MTMVIRIAPAWTTPTNALESSILGCTRHVSCYKDDFSSFHPIRPKPLSAANGEVFYATGEGGLAVYLQGRLLKLANVWYAEQVPCTLISFGSLDNAGFNVNLSDSRATVRDSQNKVVRTIPSPTVAYIGSDTVLKSLHALSPCLH